MVNKFIKYAFLLYIPLVVISIIVLMIKFSFNFNIKVIVVWFSISSSIVSFLNYVRMMLIDKEQYFEDKIKKRYFYISYVTIGLIATSLIIISLAI